jgi:hypothetical protein
MSGHITDNVFSRYNIQVLDDMRDAAQKIEAGAARATAAAAAASQKGQTATKTATATGAQAGEPRLQ